ncbi:MAG: pyruvate:ferredoxin (flavodoxin) oxidoreductase [Clostridiales bacterium]|jgi:pyruvate-ferredoxin/flavodoxin oxidoreductase|nr:pyruvate:ferredoxin (flavodoxin) oxidoreductase [Clostridiales bacterium]
MAKTKQTMDGNEAAAYASYAFTEVAGIFPITPSSPMAEHVDEWSAKGKKNIFGQQAAVTEMQSEGGAAGAVHGSLAAGALTTTYTASQGLLLMIPNMYKIAGELLPGVMHVSARALAAHALSIFGDHSDVMACRQTGFALLASTNVQEIIDLGAIAHLAAITGRVPFLHFFDGFRTSHEIQKVELVDYEDYASLLDAPALKAFRDNALNPEHPVLRGTAQNPDIFFQAKEAANRFYDALPGIVQGYMDRMAKITGRPYRLFDYYGAPDADRVIVAMGSVSDTIEETIDHLAKGGEKLGLVKVRLYRPFSPEAMFAAIPKTAKAIAVLDRTKEPGALGEPLYQDVLNAYYERGEHPAIVSGRYGLGSKDTTPGQILAVYDNLKQARPKNHFTIGIVDDVTHLSLPLNEQLDTTPPGTKSCKFWGLGSDGTVGANKNSIKIIGDHTDMSVQAYFSYDSKKSGGITVSHLRFGDAPIKSTYFVSKADFVACHNQSYIGKYDMVEDLRDGGTFLLNTLWPDSELGERLPAKVRRHIARHGIKLYTIDGISIGRELGLGSRINVIMQAAFFKLANIIPIDDAVKYMKAAALKSYGSKGEAVVEMNYKAVERGLSGVRQVSVPASWADAVDAPEEQKPVPAFIRDVMEPMNAQVGHRLPVSSFAGREDGTFPQGTTKYEKRGIAVEIPEWQLGACIQCNQCSYVCPHAVIRPFLLDEAEQEAAPAAFATKKALGKGLEGLGFRMQVSPLDCTGCGNCAEVCPAKEKALVMKPAAPQAAEIANWEYASALPPKANPLSPETVKGSQFETPLLEFSGACAGCGETPYAKLVTQLYGDRMMVANATGCSSIWGGSAPSTPYTTNHEGKGPAWANSLFEDNAEFGLGMFLGVKHIREKLYMLATELSGLEGAGAEARAAADGWREAFLDGKRTRQASAALLAAMSAYAGGDARAKAVMAEIAEKKDFLVKKSQWVFGGDGWAYDIGYGGLDHVLASGEDVNVLVFDTEVYSNTGGQSSKATPIGAVAQFAASGKATKKKDLGLMAASYGYVYVAQIAMGSSQSQAIKAITEAESYPGPSLVIAYAPCINHGIRIGMGCTQREEKLAVEAGYWHLYRFNPLLKAEGKNPFSLDSKEPTAPYRDFLMGEVRYSSLTRSFPDRAKELFVSAEAAAKERLDSYKRLAAN